MSVIDHLLHESPVGTLLLVKSDGVLSGLYLEQHRHPPKEPIGPRVLHGFEEVTRQLDEYFVRQRTEFDLPLAPKGTPFQLSVWKMLQSVPYGETWSYLQLAQALNMPTGTRAVGAANGRNPISIIVPCHRVIGADGSLTGYGGGLERKQYLLNLEGALLRPPRLAF
ncbi:methylated-DNA-[protein]-cysteine S-methyltransferase [Bryocella elongata]|uniref:Methylated-DNA--protein-cysteine methyltransferase n=1 Tax=Bryocella elongata TaxID=863522 RepID=A0A1H6A6W4_9BACT|nr:methylated-DNA--[protein]-cysteine S-methyltransferase [Bryocella elongata]SEG44468.1 methylated-DNA-[protein]-cysteine S-methyltransferase [Bryocella elongata]